MRPIALLLLLCSFSYADVVYLKGGRKLVGKVVSEEGEVVVNPYNSSHPEMQLDVVRVPASKVKRIVRTWPTPEQVFERRIAAAESADALVELAAWCAEEKLKAQRLWALERALRLDPDHAAARKALGSKAPRGRWPDQQQLVRDLFDAEKRAEAWKAIRADRAFPHDERALRRMLRSQQQKRGEQKDRPVTMRADKLATGARYTLLVPESYDPLRPTPLVIGLHGGGRGGADGKLVVGDGWQAMNFYRNQCERRGWICVCPTALEAGWGGARNNALIDAILDEICALYHIDENRIYLVGHSMGGGGTWVQGARTPERWAAIAPAASYGVRGIADLIKTRTGFYVYHSDDDQRTVVGPVRSAMKPLAGSGDDFVYTELRGQGHAFPRAVVEDIFEFFAVRRLARGRGRVKLTVRPQSSFLRKLSKDERKYMPPLPELAEEASAEGARLRQLLKQLKTGGGVAERAVPALVALEDDKTDRAVAKIMTRGQTAPDVRRYCAQVLGERKATSSVGALGKLLLMESDSAALLAGLDALGEIDAVEAGPAVVRFLAHRHRYLDQRAQNGRVDHSDWVRILPTMARACSLIGQFDPRGGAAAIASHVLGGVFLDDVAVIYDRANQNPLPAARALAAAACGTLSRLRDVSVRPTLEKLRVKAAGGRGTVIRSVQGPVAEIRGWPGDPRIFAEVRVALETLLPAPTGR
ncbi:MAG: hypothetical protein AAGD14_11760 [Planctomycetota bacterium]